MTQNVWLIAGIWMTLAFSASLISDRNLWWNPVVANFFSLAGGERTNLAGWKIAMGGDANSEFKDPMYVDPEHFDFSRG